jgi:multidrug efflux pump subunit AcrA (membrane-fusion protein)
MKENSSMRKMRNRILFVLATLLTASGCWGAWNYFSTHSKQPEKIADSAIEPSKPVMVTLGRVQDRTVEHVVDAMGTLHAFENITISAKVTGHIKRLNCDVSDRVVPNAVLLEVDSTDYDLAVRQAERSLQVELSRVGLDAPPTSDFDIKQLPSVKSAMSRFTHSQATAERTKTLVNSRASSQQDLENNLSDLRIAEADYENQLLVARAALSTIAMRTEALAISRQEQSNTIVHAPQPTQPVPYSDNAAVYAVSGRHVSEGSYVRQGTELFHLVIDSTLRLKVPVPERFAGVVHTGQVARVRVASAVDAIMGQVTRINPTIDEASRSFEVEILIDNRQGKLKPGGFAQAEIVTATNQQAVVVPWESVVTFAGVTKVFVADNDKAKEVQVTLGRQGQDWVEVVTPKLTSGTVVVTGGQSGLADGVAIKERIVASEGSTQEQASL